MDLIYTESFDPRRGIVEKGYINNAQIDIEIGTVLSGARNDFEIITTLSGNKIKKGALVYDEKGTEIGGIVYGIKVNTANNELTLKCKLWRGMLSDHIVRPVSGEDYYSYNGDANMILANMIDSGYDGLIVANENLSGINIEGKIRYESILKAFEAALAKVGARLHIAFDGAKAVCSTVPISDLSDTVCLDNDYGIPIMAEDSDNGYNHIIALGQGNLKDRQIVEMWRLSDGTITETPGDDKPLGISQRTYIYDYSSVESLEDLRKETIKQMEELAPVKTLEIEPGTLNVEIGDIVSAAERTTGISMKKQVTRKIIKGEIRNGISFLTTEYKVGD